MQVAEVTDVHSCLHAEFLTAEELVSLRKSAEDSPQPAIGEKLYNHDGSSEEEAALKVSLEGYKETLDKKRAGRICDLMQAEWNPELNIVTVPKLKGKFTQHMGRLVNGKHLLAPEEAVFLLENNCIEIMNDKTPMSTEEAFNMILKGNLALEKYQVYSHLSKLGYIVVPHQTEMNITEYEKELNLDKHPLKKKRHIKESAEGEPEKKRLTFTGALSEGSEMRTNSDVSNGNSATVSESETCPAPMEETRAPEGSERDIADKNFVEGNMPCDEEQNGNGAFVDKVSQDIQSDIDKINHTSVNNTELDARHDSENGEAPKEINSACDSKNENHAVETGEKLNGLSSQNLNELTENSKLKNDIPLENNENNDFLDSNSQSSKFVDIMDVDTDAETSCSASEVSRDNCSAFDSNINAISQDSCISLNNDDTAPDNTNRDSNYDDYSMSCSSVADEEDEILTIDGGSADNPSREDDDDVTLLEVTKKETKPLAVIDLLSDDEENEAIDVVDDDITVLEEFTSPSNFRPTASSQPNLKKLNGCKKEEPGVTSSSKAIPSLTVQFPDLFRKRVVCIARPPLELLPHHVKPSKEAYVLNLNSKETPALNNRVWNSYRDMQDYQRNRRMNRHQNSNPRGRYVDHQGWVERNSRNYVRPHSLERLNSSDAPSNSRGHGPPPTEDLNRNSFSGNSFQNNPPNNSFQPMWNPTALNCEVTVKEDSGESSVTSSTQSSHSNAFSLTPGMQNLPFRSPIPNNNFMAGIQGNPFGMGDVSHNHLMAELQRTCFTVATNMLSSMLNRNPPPFMPNSPMSMFPPGLNPCGPFNPGVSNGFGNSFNPPRGNEYLPRPPQSYGPSLPRTRPFPCGYRNILNKRSWSDVRSAVESSDSDSDIEEMPVSASDILWNSNDKNSLVQGGISYPVGKLYKFLQTTLRAQLLHKYGYPANLLPSVSKIEISFDVYPPGFTYKKTCPQIPKLRVVVVRSTDGMPKVPDVVVLQHKWNDGATLLFAVNDNGDISFYSSNNLWLPTQMPHEV